MPTRRKLLFLDFVSGESVQEAKLAGMRRYAAARGWEAVAVPEGQSRPGAVEAALRRHAPAGVVVEGSAGRADLPPGRLGVPVVYLDAAPSLHGGRGARVVADNEAVARAALRELRSNLPSALAFVGYYFRTPWADERLRAFRSIAATPGGPPAAAFATVPADRLERAGRAERLAKWLAALPRHAGVFAVNDQIAADVVAAARAAGLRVPQDLTVVGVDNKEIYSGSAGASISTIRLDHERAGFLAARVLSEIVDGKADGGAKAAYGPLLCLRRESTRGFGRREPRVAEAVERIRREACDGLTAAQVASAQPGSRRLFELRFREAMGHGVGEEILSVRLEKACTLLARTDVAIDAVAGLCGFGANSSMRQLFARRFGMSMRDWRRANRR